MTRKEIIDELCRLRSDITNAGGYVNRTDAQKNRFAQALSEEIQRLQTEPCEDCISRQAVLDTVDNLKIIIANNLPELIYKSSVLKLLHELPPVQPEQKVGHWIEQEDYDGDVYYDCSTCGNSWTTIDGTPWDNGMNYCPNCGCRMMKEGE